MRTFDVNYFDEQRYGNMVADVDSMQFSTLSDEAIEDQAYEEQIERDYCRYIRDSEA
jgi:hypothetical protein